MSAQWPARAAAGWAALFCAQSVVAALTAMVGSDLGADLFAAHFARLARAGDPAFIVTLWVAAAAKAAAALLALARTRPRCSGVTVLRLMTLACGLGFLGYGVIGLVRSVLMRTGMLAVPPSLGQRALHWHLWVWSPYWIVGGLLFLAAAARPGFRSIATPRAPGTTQPTRASAFKRFGGARPPRPPHDRGSRRGPRARSRAVARRGR